MSDQQQKLSALLDDYRDTEEDRAVLSDLQADVNLQYTQRRYQMIGDIMRNDMPSAVQPDFAMAVKAKLAQEPALAVTPGHSQKIKPEPAVSWWSSLLKPVAGLAVAASVAVVTVTSLQWQEPSDQQNAALAANDGSEARVQQLAQTPVVNSAVRVSGNSNAIASTRHGTAWKIKRGKPDVQNKLNTYLINHNEHSSSVRGIIPQARIVGFDGQQ